MTNPVPTNKTVNVVNSAIDSVFNSSLQIAQTALVNEVPFLKLPVINQIFGWLFQLIGNTIYQYLSLSVTFAIIDIQVCEETSSYNKALSALKTAQNSGNQDEINSAIIAFQAATSSLTHWDGS